MSVVGRAYRDIRKVSPEWEKHRSVKGTVKFDRSFAHLVHIQLRHLGIHFPSLRCAKQMGEGEGERAREGERAQKPSWLGLGSLQ